jgi:hypothetical protein
MGYPKRYPTLIPYGSTPAYQLLVANFNKPHTPEDQTVTGANPIRSRNGFRFNQRGFINYAGEQSQVIVGSATGSFVEPDPGAATPFNSGGITVADNDFSTGPAELIIGPYTFVAGVDFAIGGSTAATATNIAAMLDNIPDFESALVFGSDVSISYRRGPGLWPLQVFSYGTIVNFTVLVSNGEDSLLPGEPQARGNTII